MDAPLLLDVSEDQLDPAVLAALPPAMQREIKLAFMAGAKPAATRREPNRRALFHSLRPSQGAVTAGMSSLVGKIGRAHV